MSAHRDRARVAATGSPDMLRRPPAVTGGFDAGAMAMGVAFAAI